LIRALDEPVLVIDSDHRIVEVLQGVEGKEVFTLSDNPLDHADIERICEILHSEVKSCNAKSIFLDSLTTLIGPMVNRATLDAESGRFKNRSLAFKRKAILMKMLQDTLTQTGRDIFYLWHLEEGVFSGNDQVNHTVPETERKRLLRSLNALLCVVDADGRRGIRIDWSKSGVSGQTIWDDEGYWKGVPEKIEKALNSRNPLLRSFTGPEEAIQWGVSMKAFDTPESSKKRYAEIREEHKPKKASEMFSLWCDEVKSRRGNG
jgi:hypothetical protein